MTDNPDVIHDHLALALVPGLGPKLTAALLERFGTASAARAASAVQLREIPHIGDKLATSLAEALRKELGPKGIKVCNIEPAKTGADFQYESYTAKEQAQAINEETMLRAEDIAVGVHYVLTQPRRSVVQQVVIAPRAEGAE